MDKVFDLNDSHKNSYPSTPRITEDKGETGEEGKELVEGRAYSRGSLQASKKQAGLAETGFPCIEIAENGFPMLQDTYVEM